MRITDSSRVTRVGQARNPHDGVTVEAFAQVVFGPDVDRVGLYVANDSDTEKIYLGFGTTAALGEGFPLPPGQGAYIDNYDGAISAIATGTATLCWVEV